ncbi:MAG: polysaccharide pyruvyl transferase family protein [Planctomycetaceae bacterium]
MEIQPNHHACPYTQHSTLNPQLTAISSPLIMRLVPLTEFDHIFTPLRGLRVGVVDGHGNVGDHLIYLATRQLLDAFEVDWITQGPDGHEPVDKLLLFGGGNLGSRYTKELEIRHRTVANAQSRGIPLIVLPQSLMAPEPGPFETVYVRERASLQHCPTGVLAPELALGYDYAPPATPAVEPMGMFLRADIERRVRPFPGTPDPAKLCRTPGDYLALASRYGHIITDRLHFAICGLLNQRRVTLLPNSYHKNRSIWETWLSDLGCEWANDPLEVSLN